MIKIKYINNYPNSDNIGKGRIAFIGGCTPLCPTFSVKPLFIVLTVNM